MDSNKPQNRNDVAYRVMTLLRMFRDTRLGLIIEDVAAELEVSPRTIYRDIDAMRQAGWTFERFGHGSQGGKQKRRIKMVGDPTRRT